MNANIFREYDIRGIAETDLTSDVVERIGLAYGTFVKRTGAVSVGVGRDVRLSSERLSQALIKGINSTGLSVTDVGEVPTPALYYSIVHLNLGGGVMVTGSHNPIEFNGLKMCLGIAPIYGEDIQGLRRLIEAEDFETGAGSVTHHDIIAAYLDDLKSRLSISRPLKVVVDAGNGTAGPIAPGLLEDLGCEVDQMYCEPDGRFPNHLPDPTVPKYVVDLRKRVLETGADVGLGFDGDADRVGVIDDKGRIIFADRLMALYSKDLLKRVPGATVCFDVKCSQALPEIIRNAGGKPLMWKTGHSLLKAKMKEVGSPLAGEMSGHIFFGENFHGYDDALYAGAKVLQILAEDGRRLSNIADEIPHFYATPEIRVDCSDDDKFDVVARLAEGFKKEFETIDVDGARVLFGDGWGLVRASNTQPVLVLRFEAKTEERLDEIMDLFKARLQEYPVVSFRDEDFGMAA